ncbi:MAG: CsbD family protein [Opitutaceae bacterium]
MKSSTRDKAVGTAKTVSGTIKESAGRAVGNPRLQDKGAAERAEGKVQKKVGDIKKVFEK